jgi:ribosomal protein L11 methyltransferase|tara:strand:+ start:41 stop:937 length:897 start_codon:yes stop_codon:yes gene_type:complete
MDLSNYTDWYQFELSLGSLNKKCVEKIFNRHNAASITYSDAGTEPIYEPLPGKTPYWKNSLITGLFSIDTDFESLKYDLLISLEIKELPEHTVKKLIGREWEREWMKDFKPMCFGRNLWIYPEEYSGQSKGKVIVRLDPGLAFGTGTHSTTKLCLEWLDSLDLENKSILDYGCGSGILGISALKLGASKVTAIDIDPQAIKATTINALKNNIEKNIFVYDKINDSSEKYDVIVANILAEPLIMLAPLLTKMLKRNGIIGISGILISQVKLIENAYRSFVTFDSSSHHNEWSLICGSKK